MKKFFTFFFFHHYSNTIYYSLSLILMHVFGILAIFDADNGT